jgi:GTPase SAR1 family protein
MAKSYKLKLMLLGSSGSGKTSFINGNNDDDWPIGISFTLVECYANENDIYKFLIWDLKDRAHYRFMFKDFCRGAFVGLLCFDLSNRQSFLALNYWINLLREGSGNIPIILIGTKRDLENRVVKDQEILDLIKDKNLDTIFFTSIYEENDAKQEIFRYIVQKLDQDYPLSNFSILPRELEDDQFKQFLTEFSICPICKSELNY